MYISTYVCMQPKEDETVPESRLYLQCRLLLVCATCSIYEVPSIRSLDVQPRHRAKNLLILEKLLTPAVHGPPSEQLFCKDDLHSR